MKPKPAELPYSSITPQKYLCMPSLFLNTSEKKKTCGLRGKPFDLDLDHLVGDGSDLFFWCLMAGLQLCSVRLSSLCSVGCGFYNILYGVQYNVCRLWHERWLNHNLRQDAVSVDQLFLHGTPSMVIFLLGQLKITQGRAALNRCLITVYRFTSHFGLTETFGSQFQLWILPVYWVF